MPKLTPEMRKTWKERRKEAKSLVRALLDQDTAIEEIAVACSVSANAVYGWKRGNSTPQEPQLLLLRSMMRRCLKRVLQSRSKEVA